MRGAIAGDVVGSVREWANVKSVDFALFESGARCTDDSVLTVATADALMGDGDYGRAYREYFQRFPAAGYGGLFARWANRGDREPYGSWGNGSAMRVSPVGWARESLEAVLDEAHRSASVTHDHPEGILGAQAAAACVYLARTERSRERIREFVRDGCGYSLERSLDDLRPTYAFDASCRGTVPVAVQAFLESRSFEDAVRLAVSVGGDSDTIACIAGAIAHAYYGEVPAHMWRPVQEVYLHPTMAEVVEAFCEQFAVA